MQPLRGTKDILPSETEIWQHVYDTARQLLSIYNYKEVRTPIIESTDLFEKCIGNFTDIVNKEMYTFNDQSNRSITLRPEGTSSIARAVISNKLSLNNQMNRLWYAGPMFRYERPQKGRQRQFHQLGIECIGSAKPVADTEVIQLADKILTKLQCKEECNLELNSIGNIEERKLYTEQLIKYLKKYEEELDKDSQRRINTNPLRILDSKIYRTQEILNNGPILKNYLSLESLKHFEQVCKSLDYLNIKYTLNSYLVRGLDYYNYTAFEIKTKSYSHQNTLCGGGRYDNLIEQLGGPKTPAVGWAIGLERLMILIKQKLNTEIINKTIYIATENLYDINVIWDVINILEKYCLKFELDITDTTTRKKIKKASKLGVKICMILRNNEISNKQIIIKWLDTGKQQIVNFSNLDQYTDYLKTIF
uniref:Histidine--tRNA ligase, chloroplastic n=1 Tax=Vertebrata thuyoides TaxID=2006970 RepID=A0A1Z1MB66_9FLOR|nr:Histidine-tRNA ligase [Vertebrata thuyoides]ARW63210.1 Histidine-tRNA ligase [Vertebrata thuyoides]